MKQLQLKKGHKILLFLVIGLSVFLFFWNKVGRPGFTFRMAMRQLERHSLVEDTDFLLVADGEIPSGRQLYKNILTADDAYLYYCEMRCNSFLFGLPIGDCYPNTPLWYSPRGKTVSYILGNVQTVSYGDLHEPFILPLFVMSEDPSMEFDEVRASLSFDYRGYPNESGLNCMYTYTGQCTYDGGLVRLDFLENSRIRTGPQPLDGALDSSNSIWKWLRYIYETLPMELTVSLYNNGTQVYTETTVIHPRS